MLLYHGRKKCQYRTLSDLFEGFDPQWRQFVPNYEYIFHNLGEIPDEELRALNNKFLAASFLAMKYSLAEKQLEKWIPEILALVQEADSNLQSSLIVYTFECSGLKEGQILALLETLPKTIKRTVMSTADFFVEKGRKEGQQLGRLEEREKLIRNLLRIAVLNDEQIAAAAEVETEYVTKIRKEIGYEYPDEKKFVGSAESPRLRRKGARSPIALSRQLIPD